MAHLAALGALSTIGIKPEDIVKNVVAGKMGDLKNNASGMITTFATDTIVKNGTSGTSGTEGTGENAGNEKKSYDTMGYYKIPIKGTTRYMNIFTPNELVDDKNSRILLNIIMLYAINYINKYKVLKENYDVLKEIRDYLKIYKSFLNDKISTLSKDYLDIVRDAVEDIKLSEERDFLKLQSREGLDNATKISDNDRTFNYIKLFIENISGLSGGIFTTITSAIANIWKVMMIWTKPFAGLVILVGFIIFIILMFFGEDDTSSGTSGGVGTGSLISPSNFNFFSNTGGGANNNNTDIISVLQRLPQNIYSFFDKLSAAYSRFSDFVNSSSDLINNLSDTTPIIKSRVEKPPAEQGIHDNIYTFDYKYIKDIKGATTIDDIPEADSVKISADKTHIYNIKRPKKGNNSTISEYYGISHAYKFDKVGVPSENEYIYAPKCGTDNDYVFDDCTIKKIDECGEVKEEDTSDYKNIII